MEDPTVAISVCVTARVADIGLGRKHQYDVYLGSTFDLRTEQWLADNTCVY